MSNSRDISQEKVPAAIEKMEAHGEKNVVESVLSMPSRLGKSAAVGDQPDTRGVKRIDGVVIGRLERFSEDGSAEVSYPGNPSQDSQVAVTTVKMAHDAIGKEVALAFLDGKPNQPIILGLVQHPEQAQAETGQAQAESRIDVQLDGERVTLSADKEIVLKCGKASITLTRAGKIIVKGAYVSTHSTGVNRIKGGSVQLN